jgi:signal transduction histidine kinase/CheY-like chemotaxis protein
MFHIDIMYPFGNFGITLYVFILAYAILRYRLMDIHLIFKRTMVYSLSAGLLTGLLIVLVIALSDYLSEMVGITSFVITVCAALIIALLFNPLKGLIQSLVDKVFYKTTYNYYESIQKISHELISTVNLKNSYRIIVDTLFEILKLKGAFLLRKGQNKYVTVYCRTSKDKKISKDYETVLSLLEDSAKDGSGEYENRKLLDSDSELIGFVQEKGIIIKEELPILLTPDEAGNIEQDLAPYRGEIAVPIMIEHEISFLLILGEKLSGDMFFDEDINLLKTVANQAAIAIKNAKLYDELEKGIAERTEAVHQLKHEISERKKLEDQLLQSQKMEAIGRLAGGIAHDFNNILSSIMGYSEISLMKLSKDHPIFENIQIVHDASKKASSLTEQLLAYSRKQILRMKAVNLNETIKSMTKMLKRLIGEKIVYEFHALTPLSDIWADQGQIEQILMNLSINARDAMPEGGSLVIETTEVRIGQEREHPEMKPGIYVKLIVKDSGTGMIPEVQENIFEPFFTTKGIGKGTGLGLSTVYGIVKQHNGYIYVESELGKGTTFSIYLHAHQRETTAVENDKHIEIPRGKEVLLVVEDDDQLRKLIVEVLQNYGYKLLDAGSGEEAIEKAREYPGDIDVLLSDVIMPGINGDELADVLLKRRPDMKVVFMSGYPVDTRGSQGILGKDISFLQKPITMSKLAEKLREVISRT